MTDATIIVQTAPQEQQAPAKPKQPRQMVRFTFYKLDPQWQLLPLEQRQQGKQELQRIVEEWFSLDDQAFSLRWQERARCPRSAPGDHA